MEKLIYDLQLGIRFAETRGYGGLADVMRDALELLKPREPMVMNLDDLLTTSGAGWEESWFREEEGEADEVVLEPCAWCNGHLILESGSNSDLHDERSARYYNRSGNGFRIWRGDKPTDEQREAVKWDG